MPPIVIRASARTPKDRDMSQEPLFHTYEIKSASLSLVSFLLKSADLASVQADVARRLGATPGFFDHDPVVIDLSQIDAPQAEVDFASLCLLLRAHQLLPVAVRGLQDHHRAAAAQAGLFEAQDVQTLGPRTETVVQEVVR